MWRWAAPRLRELLAEPRGASRREGWFSSLTTSTDLLEIADMRGQFEVAVGLPRVDPYLDDKMVRLLASFPPAELCHGHRYRGLFSLAMRGVLPDSVRLRPDKASFDPLPGAILGAVDPQVVRGLVGMEALADLGLVRPREFRDAFARVERGEGGGDWLDVWPALAIEAFVRGAPGTASSRPLPPLPVARARHVQQAG
jgi:asparagine synthase (glutamine-hydrolysing)